MLLEQVTFGNLGMSALDSRLVDILVNHKPVGTKNFSYNYLKRPEWDAEGRLSQQALVSVCYYDTYSEGTFDARSGNLKACTSATFSVYDLDCYEQEGQFLVNNRFRRTEDLTLRLPLTHNNKHSAQQFVSAYPSQGQLNRIAGRKVEALGMGKEITLYSTKGEPLITLELTSHSSLSPVTRIH